jgi:hypothetical protein
MGKRGENRERRSAILEPDAAGIDIGAEEIYVAAPPHRDEQATRNRVAVGPTGQSEGSFPDDENADRLMVMTKKDPDPALGLWASPLLQFLYQFGSATDTEEAISGTDNLHESGPEKDQ